MSEQLKKRIFLLSCIALTVTSMTFAIRAGILAELGANFGLSTVQLGWMNAMAFLGFPVATILGGLLYNSVGAKRLLIVAFLGHVFGLIMTTYAQGFLMLLISTFFVGFANGAVEAACNPLIVNLYQKRKTAILNLFHVWFPAGLMIGALVTQLFVFIGLSWQWQIAIMLLPTLVYGVMIFSTTFPDIGVASVQKQTEVIEKNRFQGFVPALCLFLFLSFCMSLTATTELGTQQWIELILKASGASPMLVLALIAGVMALGRFFVSALVLRYLSPMSLLWVSSVLASIGVYGLSVATGNAVYLAALVFSLGVMSFWPTMVGMVSEHIPQSGALGLSIIAAVGMMAVSMWNPVIGQWIEEATIMAMTQNLSVAQTDLFAGQQTLSSMTVFPLLLVVAFSVLWIVMRYVLPTSKKSGEEYARK